MSCNPLISVIIPVYNAGKYFNHCIQSIIEQSYKNLEIIIVDDGSNDGTSLLCDEFEKKDNRIKVIHKDNGGAASARNTGLDNASGKYIGFIDADDYLDSDAYEIMLSELIENDADAVRCGIERVADDGTTEDWGTGNYDIRTVDNKQLLKDIGEGFGILPVSPCNKIFKKDCIGNIRFNTDFKFAEDTLFNFMVAKNISKMVYHDVNRYHYSFNTNSITNNDISENNFDEHRVMDVIFSLADDETLPYCIKGDVLKSLRTIKQIILSNKYTERFSTIRKRIISNRRDIFTLPIYSRLTKLRVLLLWIAPSIYKLLIKKFR